MSGLSEAEKNKYETRINNLSCELEEMRRSADQERAKVEKLTYENLDLKAAKNEAPAASPASTYILGSITVVSMAVAAFALLRKRK